jgi:secretion/DNA translocation related TadE-like protein
VNDQRGSVTVLTVASMVVACVLCLVAVDLFRVVDVKARAQTAADAAALAAARELAIPSPQSPAEAAAEYARLNGATLKSCACERGSLQAVVAVEMTVRLVFLHINRPLIGRARAVVEQGGTGP